MLMLQKWYIMELKLNILLKVINYDYIDNTLKFIIKATNKNA